MLSCLLSTVALSQCTGTEPQLLLCKCSGQGSCRRSLIFAGSNSSQLLDLQWTTCGYLSFHRLLVEHCTAGNVQVGAVSCSSGLFLSPIETTIQECNRSQTQARWQQGTGCWQSHCHVTTLHLQCVACWQTTGTWKASRLCLPSDMNTLAEVQNLAVAAWVLSRQICACDVSISWQCATVCRTSVACQMMYYLVGDVCQYWTEYIRLCIIGCSAICGFNVGRDYSKAP